MANVTNLKKYEMLHPINPFDALQLELNRLIKDFGGNFEAFNYPFDKFENFSLTPAVDIVDEKDKLKIEMEMPGMSEEDVKVSISNGMLVIKGEKTTSKKDKDKHYMSREIKYGSYERRLNLPSTVDLDKAKATFKKGMLWIEFPKKIESIKDSREIPVLKG